MRDTTRRGLYDSVFTYAGATPSVEAVVVYEADGTVERRTWRQLSEEVVRRAEKLRRIAASPDLVLIELGRGIEAITSFTAAQAVGADVFCIDRRSEEHLTEWVDYCAMEYPCRLVIRDEGTAVVGQATSVRTRQPAYVVATGGTTGRARLVRIPFQPPGPPPALYSATGWRTGQRCFVAGSLAHSAALSCVISAISDHSTVFMMHAFDGARAAALLTDERIEWLQLTPSHMRALVPHLEQARLWVDLVALLHTGGPCPIETKRRWIQAVGATRIFDMYAATEAIGATLCRGDEWEQRPGTVGRGFMCRIRIVDDRGGELPRSTVGTVYMQTLRNRHEETTAVPGYRTVDDLGWLDDQGYLYLAGRTDDLVLVEGENVYLNDVASVVLEHEDVADAAVVALDEPGSTPRLVGLVAPREGAAITANVLTGHCLQRLPPLAVPRRWRIVESLVRSPNGKTDPLVLNRLAKEATRRVL